jgi:hypothetical protein
VCSPMSGTGQPQNLMPRLAGRLSAVLSDAGLLIATESRRLVFRTGGPAVASVLQRILPLLDGNHDCADICALAGLAAGELVQALTAFEQAGILEWDRPDVPATVQAAHVRDYISGSMVKRAGYESSHAIRQLLAVATVILVCDSEVSHIASTDLRTLGVGNVVIARAEDSPATLLKSFADGILVCQEACGETTRLDRWLKELHPGPPRILRLNACSQHVEIGPVFGRGYPCCIACFRSSQADCAASRLDGGAGVSFPLEDASFTAALLVSRLVSLLVGDGSLNSWGRTVWTLTPEGVASGTRSAVVPDVSCAECGWAFGDATVGVDVRAAAQDALTTECLAEGWREGSARAHLATQKPAKASTPWYSRYLPSVALDRIGTLGAPEDPPASRIHDQRFISALLDVAGRALEQFAGADGNGGQSKSKHGGMVTPYLLAQSGIFEIPGSVFAYTHRSRRIVATNAEKHSLTLYRDSVGRYEKEACSCPGQHLPERRVVIVFVGPEFSDERSSRAGWRLAHLQTGHALNELAAFARNAGVRMLARTATGQSALPGMLELWPGREAITAMAEIALNAGDHRCR